MITNEEVRERVEFLNNETNRDRYELEFICLSQDIIDRLAQKIDRGSLNGEMIAEFRRLWRNC